MLIDGDDIGFVGEFNGIIYNSEIDLTNLAFGENEFIWNEKKKKWVMIK